jgi:hypothetical protein
MSRLAQAGGFRRSEPPWMAQACLQVVMSTIIIDGQNIAPPISHAFREHAQR